MDKGRWILRQLRRRRKGLKAQALGMVDSKKHRGNDSYAARDFNLPFLSPT